MKFFNVLAFLLVIIGALNWGLWGFFQFDFVAWFSHGNTTWLSRLIYAIIGLSGLWSLRFIPRCKHICCDMEKCGCGCGCGCEKGKCGCDKGKGGGSCKM